MNSIPLIKKQVLLKTQKTMILLISFYSETFRED